MNIQTAHGLVDEVRDAGDALVVGTGVAGLTAALALGPLRVTVLTKTRLGRGGSSAWAQGGVAAAMGRDDSPRLHADDTLAAGAGLSLSRPVAVLTEEGPAQVRRLIERGARFDRTAGGTLALGREGAHSRRRVLHANGDATGAEMVRALVESVSSSSRIEIVEFAAATDLALEGPEPGAPVRGVVARVTAPDGSDAKLVLFTAPAVVLATGGFGQAYARTTNPVENTGDGLALAARAGAELADLEMVQFHPTALDVDADPLPLVTEALRGEGAILVDEAGERFMPAIHPLAELAPRDIVARALWRRRAAGLRSWLDTRAAVGDAFPERFPTVWAHCQAHGIDPRVEPIPVTPAAHYSMAGIASDASGRTSVEGLWVCGEASSTGIHGANRLASNSLLEALVFGERVGLSIARSDRRAFGGPLFVRRETSFPAETPAARGAIRELLWDGVGLLRDAASLEGALQRLADLATAAPSVGLGPDAAPGEVANLWTIGRLVAAAALARQESRGSHFRSDFPETDTAWQRRLAWHYRPDRPELSPLEPAVPPTFHFGVA